MFTPNKKQLAVLIDPEQPPQSANLLAKYSDLFLIGGSGCTGEHWEKMNEQVLKTGHPCYIFPGNHTQIFPGPDGVLVLNLLSGNNPTFLGGEQIKGARAIQRYGLTPHPTAYLLIDGGKESTTQRVTQTQALPNAISPLLESTCLAATQMGNSSIYLEAGSGALHSVKPEVVAFVKKTCPQTHLFVGGGIRTKEQTKELWAAGADTLVIGNALEEKPEILKELWKQK